MKINFFLTWIVLRIILTSIVAFWGFFMIFKDGINSGGKILLIIAMISYAVSVLQLYLHTRMKKSK